MVKEKPAKSDRKVPNKHLHARTTFLYQAGTYLTLQTGDTGAQGSSAAAADPQLAHPGLALQLGAQLRGVSLKGQIRLSAQMKRSVCKACNAILIPGRTATHVIENKSKGGNKPWADVLVVECRLCGGKKRFPVGATRQKRKTERGSSKASQVSDSTLEVENTTTPALPTNTEGSTKSD